MTYLLVELAVPTLVSLAASKIMLDWWLKTALKLGFVGRDMNKPGHPLVAEAGGLWVVLSTAFGVLAYTALKTYIGDPDESIPLLAISMTLLLAGLLGFVDDILGWKKGLSPVKRVLLTAPIALPLVVVKAGYTVVDLPLLGLVNLGVLYPLVVVPIGVLGASNAFNMIAGYNGLEALQAVVLLAYATVLMLLKGYPELAFVALPAIASTALFYVLYNRYPAKMFPGNSFTYGFGAFYASLAIYWNFEKYAILSFALYFIELALFLRGLANGVYKENFGRVLANGSLEPPYDKSYSLTHIAIRVVKKLKGRCREPDVVYFIVFLQALVCTAALALTAS